MALWRTERFAGVLSGVLGVVGLVVVLFGPVYPYTAYLTSGVVQGAEGLLVTPHGSLWLPSLYIVPITVSLVPPLLILIGAFIHSRQPGSRVGLILLVGATVAFLVGIIFNPIQLLQLFLLPSLFLALIASALAFRNGRQSSLAVAGEAHG